MSINESPRLFLVAGEESGDLHGAKLIDALKKHLPSAHFMGHGGDKMDATGMEVLYHINDLAMMGFTEVVKHLPFMMRVMNRTLEKIQEFKPHRLILIDYPGFNLRLAKKIHPVGVPMTYFILPQVWAWQENRVNTIRECVDQALCIFPFEQDWFQQRGVDASFVGHPFTEFQKPTMDKVTFYSKHNLDQNRPLLVLFPGSRQQEVDRHFPVFKEVVSLIEDINFQVIIGKAPQIKLGELPSNWTVETDDTSLCLEYGTAVLTSSGTATLQAAVQDIPAVVCYKMSVGTWFLAKNLSHAPFAAMTNLIAERQIVPEFLQQDMTPAHLANAITPLLKQTPQRKAMLLGYEEVRRTLGLPGVYERGAEAIINRMFQ